MSWKTNPPLRQSCIEKNGTGIGFTVVSSNPMKTSNQPGLAEMTPAKRASRSQVLVVDDNETNQLVAEAVLKSLDCDVTLVSNGAEAVAATSRKRFDIVFMDCQMPVMDGYAATAAIRSNERVSSEDHLPIVALTANVIEGSREECLAAGMDDYLSKPFSREQLHQMLKRWVASAHVPAS